MKPAGGKMEVEQEVLIRGKVSYIEENWGITVEFGKDNAWPYEVSLQPHAVEKLVVLPAASPDALRVLREAITALRAQLYRMCVARGDAANGSLTWPEIRVAFGELGAWWRDDEAPLATSSGASALAHSCFQKGGATMPLRDGPFPQRKQDCGDAPSAELRTSAAPAASEAGESADHAGQAAWEAAMAFIQDKPGLEKFPLLAECRDAIVNALAIRDASREQRGVEKGLEMVEKYGRTTLPGDTFITTDEQRRCYEAGVQTACDRIAHALAHPASAAGEEEQP